MRRVVKKWVVKQPAGGKIVVTKFAKIKFDLRAAVLAAVLPFFAAAATDKTLSTAKQIAQNELSLKDAKEAESGLNDKLKSLAAEIKKAQRVNDATQERIDKLSRDITLLHSNIGKMRQNVARLESQSQKLSAGQDEIMQTLVNVIGQDFAFDLIAQPSTQEAVIADEMLKELHLIIKDDLGRLANEYEKASNEIVQTKSKIKQINEQMNELGAMQNRLVALQKQQSKDIALLQNHKGIYQKELAQIQERQRLLASTLKELKIIENDQKLAQIEEQQEAQNEVAQNKAGQVEQTPKEGETKTATYAQKSRGGDVKRVGSSYQSSKVRAYRGAKTIAPLKNYVVKQKFGDFVDPIYKIKIFNELVTLSSKVANENVRNVLDGKVVFVRDSGVLGLSVIVQNANGIHTIYAKLNSINPKIKVGVMLKKGEVIGKIKQDLAFSVTQKNYYINPMELIQ